MVPSVSQVVPQEDFTLSITYDNGEEAIFDMKPYLNFGVLSRLKNGDQFKRVRVSFDTVAWDCGVDLDPEFIYQKSQKTSRV